MPSKEKIALFDFCETIANFQTADAYVRYVLSHQRPAHPLYGRIYKAMNKIHLLGVIRRLFPRFVVDKKLLLLQLRGMQRKDLEKLAKDYYEEKIKPNMIEPVLKELVDKQKSGYKIYVVSAGYSIYLRYFAEEYHIDGLIASTLKFDGEKFKGWLQGHDCMYEHKIAYIKGRINCSDRSEWFAYSDSETDLPMLSLVGNPVAISKDKPQEWAELNNINQLIWK